MNVYCKNCIHAHDLLPGVLCYKIDMDRDIPFFEPSFDNIINECSGYVRKWWKFWIREDK